MDRGCHKPKVPGIAGSHPVLEEYGKYSSLEPLDGVRFFRHLEFWIPVRQFLLC